MSQYQQPTYGDPQDPYMDQPRKTSGMAVTALILSIIGLIPCIGVCTAPFGILLGLIGAVTIGGARKGRGLAIAAVIIGIVGGGVQYWMGTTGWNKFVVPVMEGPNDALVAGFDGDVAGFRAATHDPAASATDEEILTFIETLRQRYGNIQGVEMNQQAQGQQPQPQMGSQSAPFPYIYQFENATVTGWTEIVFADQTTGAMVMKPSVITIQDPDLGDVTFPPGATPPGPGANGTGTGNGDGAEGDGAPADDAEGDGSADGGGEGSDGG